MTLLISAALAGAGSDGPTFHLSARMVNAAFDAAIQKLISDCGTCDPSFGNRYSAAKCKWTTVPDVAECRLSYVHFDGPRHKIVSKLKRIDDDRWIAID